MQKPTPALRMASLFGRRAAASMRCADVVSAFFALVAVLGLAAYHPSVHAQSPLNNATKVAAGGNHTCALTASGGAKCWGFNAFGQLGIGGRNYGLPGDVLQVISVPPVAVPVTSLWSLILLVLLGGLITVQVVRRN